MALIAIEHDPIRDGFVLRYHTTAGSDALPPGGVCFWRRSVWFADNYVLQNRYAEARERFERLMLMRNGVGLAEEQDPPLDASWESFRPALSHLALVNTAQVLLSPKFDFRLLQQNQGQNRHAAPVG